MHLGSSQAHPSPLPSGGEVPRSEGEGAPGTPDWLRWPTFVVVLLIALSAAGGLVHSTFHAVNLAGPAVWLLVLGLAGVGAFAWRLRAGDGWVLPALAALVLSRSLIAWHLDAPLISDFLDYHNLAVGVANGGPWLQEGRPMGWPLILGAAYALFGPHPWLGEALNVAFALLGGVALWALVRPLAGPAAAALALAAYVLWPQHAQMTAVVGTEIVYATFFLAAGAALVRARPEALGWALAAGALTGLAQWVRPTTLALVPAALLGLWLVGRRPRVVAALAGLYLAGLLVVLAPVAEWNHRVQGKWSLSTSAYGGWSLLVGMNQRHMGMWNVDDAATAERLGGLKAVDAYARAEGIRRMTSDPVGTARLVAVKFPVMWAMEGDGTYWTLGTRQPPDPRTPVDMALLTLLAQAFYAGVAVLAARALRLRELALGWAPLFGGLLTLAAVHSLLEVQGRYHFYWTPLLIALAAVTLCPQRGEVTRTASTR